MEIKYIKAIPTLSEFKELRKDADWSLDKIDDLRVRISLSHTPYCICAYHNNHIVGMIRIAGDKGMYGYIQDTIVKKQYQGNGIGTEMLKLILAELKYKPGYLLGVCPSKVSVNFYEKLGFRKRPENPNGFMSLTL